MSCPSTSTTRRAQSATRSVGCGAGATDELYVSHGTSVWRQQETIETLDPVMRTRSILQPPKWSLRDWDLQSPKCKLLSSTSSSITLVTRATTRWKSSESNSHRDFLSLYIGNQRAPTSQPTTIPKWPERENVSKQRGHDSEKRKRTQTDPKHRRQQRTDLLTSTQKDNKRETHHAHMHMCSEYAYR